ncbi:MAG: hypothetical protein H7346_06910 [Burkholderiaceae bacterium]|nr:hypothetical protein [Burkholderiaceae bacterium]
MAQFGVGANTADLQTRLGVFQRGVKPLHGEQLPPHLCRTVKKLIVFRARDPDAVLRSRQRIGAVMASGQGGAACANVSTTPLSASRMRRKVMESVIFVIGITNSARAIPGREGLVGGLPLTWNWFVHSTPILRT